MTSLEANPLISMMARWANWMCNCFQHGGSAKFSTPVASASMQCFYYVFRFYSHVVATVAICVWCMWERKRVCVCVCCLRVCVAVCVCVHAALPSYSHPEATLCGWQDIKIQKLINLSTRVLSHVFVFPASSLQQVPWEKLQNHCW